MDKFNAMSIGEKIILIAGAVLLIASFLPWYRVSAFGFTFSAHAWEAPNAIWSILAVLVGLVLSATVAARTFTDVKLPADIGGQSWGRIFLGGGALVLLLLVIKFLAESSNLSYGFYIGFLSAVALAAGGALLFRDEGGVLPGMGGGDSPGGSPPSGSPPPSDTSGQ